MKRLGLIFLIGFSAAACGDDKTTTTPPTPTAPAATVTGLSVAGVETLRTGQTQTYTATVNMSNGTSQAASPTWTSDNTSVLSINSTGAANALAQGRATVIATTQGVTGTRLVSVWQDYQGTWSGSYQVRVCTEQGALFVGFVCRPTFRVGTMPGPLRLTLTQNGPAASGALELGSFVHSMSGGIFDSRHFVGGGVANFDAGGGVTINSRVGTLDALSSASGLSGTIIFTLTIPGAPGNAYVEADLSGVTRTSTLTQPGRIRNYTSLSEALAGFRGE